MFELLFDMRPLNKPEKLVTPDILIFLLLPFIIIFEVRLSLAT